MANYNECEYVGIDYKIVERFEKRIVRLLKDMDKHGISLFCGSSCSIRYSDGENRDLLLGDFVGRNADGGCGAAVLDKEGLLRGE